MRVIHIPRRFVQSEWGGTETTILNICRAMNAQGDQSEIYTSKALCPIEQESLQGVNIRRFSYTYPFCGLDAQDRLQMDKKGGNLLSLGLLKGLLKRRNVDILHAHTGKRTGAVVRTAAKLLGLPYVVTLHGGFFDVPADEAAKILEPNSRAGLEWGKGFGALLGARRVLDDADAIVCVGENEALAARKALPHKRIEQIPNGVDTEFFAKGEGASFRDRYGISQTAKVLLCVGRIDYQKNQIGLVKAFSTIVSQMPEAHLVMVGPVTVPEYGAELEQLIERQALSDRITLIPGLAFGDSALADAYHAADVFCLPSKHEPFGIVVLEAWAAGLPVVAAKIGGIPSFTVDGEDCLWCDPDSSADIASQCLKLINDRVLSRKLADAGKNKVVREYSWTAVTARLKALYQSLLEARSA